jgi:nitrogen regulatory protein P-II 1
MKLLVYVLNQVELLDKFIKALKEAGIKGATIIPSSGMASRLFGSDDQNLIGSLRMIFDQPRKESNVIMMALEDEQVDTVFEIVDVVLGGVDKPNTGILFTVPIDKIKGYKKRV